nr:2-amino-4-hydroxy-6-hydroxymethyldihydropteridine diphosphokinase [Treponema phagedenis]
MLGLGSNQGDSRAILQAAVKELRTFLDDLEVSSLYRTKPQDYLEQNDFYNLAVCGFFSGEPHDLLDLLHTIENKHGRIRPAPIIKGPRTLDIDILFFGRKIINTDDLTVPHPAIAKRAFVLIPLLELCPKYSDPISGKLYAHILALLPDQGVENIGSLH